MTRLIAPRAPHDIVAIDGGDILFSVRRVLPGSARPDGVSALLITRAAGKLETETATATLPDLDGFGDRPQILVERFAGTATSRPPDVCGSMSSARSASVVCPHSTRVARYAAFRSAPPVLVPCSHVFMAPGSKGTRSG
jgi:hypothetical protein